MTLQFPSDPINGAVSGDYTYDAVKGAWRKNAALPVSVTHSDVAPSNPREGDQWWKSDEGTLFTYYNDGSSSQWVESTNVVANVEPNPIPAGAMMAWGSDTIPSNWLLCDGSAISRSTYASLFAAIGTQYGSGDGTTTFNLPNIKGRTIVGMDASQTEFDVLGETGGAKTHTLLISEMPSHTHIQNAHNHTQDAHNHTQNSHGHSINDPGHQHYLDQGPYTGGGNYSSPGVDNRYLGNAPTRFATTGISINGNTATNNATTATNQATTATNQNTGGDTAHNNLQPYIVLNYIIKFSAGETPGDSQLAVRVGTLETQNNATPISQNYLINGGFDIWQRGTSVTNCGEGVYFADRWAPNEYQTNRVSRSLVTAGQGPVSQYAIRSATRASASRGVVYQKIESINSIPLRGKTVTFSFWMRSSASSWVSSATDYVGFRYYLGFNTTTSDGAVGQAAGGFDSSVSGLVTNGSLPTSWTRYSISATVPLTANNVAVRMGMNSDGTAANDAYWFEVTDVQLEEGSYATPFRRNAPSIQAELAACKRYFQKSFLYDTVPADNTTANTITPGAWAYTAGYATTSYMPAMAYLEVEMRVAPHTVVIYQPNGSAGAAGAIGKFGDIYNRAVNSSYTAALGVEANSGPPNAKVITFVPNGGSGVSNVSNPYGVHWTASAEL